MAYISIDNFKWGLDTRKSVLSSQPGTLVTAANCHVNEGGEIELRKAFTSFATDTVVDANGDHAFFGLEASSFGILTFTHDQASAGSCPAGLTPRVLLHPEVYDGGTYNRVKHRITSVPFSRTFQGNVLVFATFADGGTYGYYCQTLDSAGQATIIDHFRNGVFFGQSNVKTDIKRQINAITGWLAEDADTAEGSFDQIVSIKSPASITFSAATSVTNSSDKFGFSAIQNSSSNGTLMVRAWASFQVTASPAASTILVVDNAGHDLGRMIGTGDTVTDAAALALSINKLTGITGYSAAIGSTTSVVWVYAPTNANPGALAITLAGGATIGATAGTQGFFVTLSPKILSKTISFRPIGGRFGSKAPCVSDFVLAQPNGGTAPYTYAWTEVGGTSGIGINYPTAAMTTFTAALSPGQSLSGSFRCTVTTAAPVLTSFCDIQVSLNYALI